MTSLKFHVLILIFSLIPMLIPAATPVLPNFPVAKPNCTEHCGHISIPFPFGTTESCSYNSTFLVNCTETPGIGPQLFLGDTDIEIKNISLDDGQLKMMRYIAKRCYDPTGTEIIRLSAHSRLSYMFRVSNTANKFTIIGCDSYGYVSGRRWSNRNYSTGCMATCDGMNDLEEGSCMGMGCCQISDIPNDIRTMNLTVGSFYNHTYVMGFNNCTYGFVVDNAFKFYRENLTNLRNVEKLPVVVDWVIGRETCDSAQTNQTRYACISPDSECYEPINGGDGYRCRCNTGYEGNPYLSDGRGCKDINECDFPELSKCKHKDRCHNSPGNFTCSCPKGYKGNGVGEGGCTQSRSYKIEAGIALGIILVMLVICLLYMELKRRRSKKRKDVLFLQNGGKLLQDLDPVAKIYSLDDLQIATNNFHSSMIVGQGGFGTVYKGFLEDNGLVAIKKSKEVDPTQIEQFVNEYIVLSRISHRNVVKLLGCCLDTEVPLLVYEFVNNGTLYDHIHNPDKKHFLDWNLRLKIATEAADVLSYLHSAASTPIIHRDVKSANILLGEEFKAKVSDFGASRLVPMDQTQLPTMVLGTLGYLDPEYMQTQQLTEKSDVYSFGVVLVELITGMKAINNGRPDKEKCLANYFLCKLKQGHLVDVLDETIVWDVNLEKQVIGVANIARLCLNVRGEDRPSMKEVATELEGLKLGGRRSWANLEQNAEENGSFSGKGFDGFVDVDGYNTSMSYDSLRVQTNFSGGR